MSSDSNSLAREFLTDVNRLCNAVVQRAESKEEEEEETHMAALGQYLVQGRGFILLTKLNLLIDQALTCREELLTLLLSLLPLVWKIPVQEEKALDFNLPFSSDIIWTKETNSSSLRHTQEKLHLEGSTQTGQVSAKASISRRSRRHRKPPHHYSVRDERKSQLSTSDSEANSDDKSIAMIKHRRSNLLQRFLSSSSKENQPLIRQTERPDTVILENVRPIIPRHESNSDILNESAAFSIISNMNNSPFDLCHVLLSLLEKVCKFDITLNHNSALAVSVVPTLTEFLAGFGACCSLSGNSESEVSTGWTEEPIALVQRMLFRTVLHLMSVDINTAETMPESLRKNLIDLLRAALKIRACLEKQPDPFSPRPKKTLQEVQDDFVFSRYRHRALLLPELLEGVLQILICCLQSATSNPFYFSQAMDLVQEFIQHHGFKLFETAVLQMEWLVSRDEVSIGASEHLRTLINSVMKIISTVKKVKSEQLHQSMCTRKRHRRCEYSHFMHHHRDLSGLLVSAFKNQISKNPFEEMADGEVYYPERCCCIAVCAHQCLRLLKKVSLNTTCIQILSGVNNVGICCCMDPKSVIIPLLHAFKLPKLKHLQQHILNILNKFILDQLGGGEISQKTKYATCNICTFDHDQLAQLEETMHAISHNADPASLSSPSYKSQGILPSSGFEDLLWKWDALQAYQSILFEEDRLHSVHIASHICNLIQKGNAIVQWKLYNYIFNPVLQRGVELAHHSQQLGVSSSCSNACSYHSQCLLQEVLQIYLQTLPTLFKSRVIRDLFLSCNGVNQMIELNYLDGIRNYSLKAFETLIASLGEQQKDEIIPEVDGINKEKKVSSIVTSSLKQQVCSDSSQSLSKFYAGLKEICPKKQKAVGQDIHINMINLFLCVAFLCVSKEADCDRDSTNDSEDTSGYDSTASEPLNHMLPCLSPEILILPSPEHIHRAADIWSMCRWIYMLNSVFQKQFHRLGGFQVCYKLIIMIIQKLSRNKEKARKVDNHIYANENTDFEGNVQSEMTVKEDALHLSVNNASSPLVLGSLEENTESLDQLDSQEISSEYFLSIKPISTSVAALKEPKVSSQEHECTLQSIRLLEALLTICLHSSKTNQQKIEVELPNQTLSVENVLFEIQDHLSQSKVVETDLAKPVLDALLRVALGNYSADLNHSEEKIEKSEAVLQQGDLSEEVEETHGSFKLFAEEEGYEADSESDPEDSESQDEDINEIECISSSSYLNDAIENFAQGELIYPEICILELNLLSTSKVRVAVLGHVFESFLKIIRQKEKNVTLLMQKIVLMDLLVSLMSSRTCSEELTFLLRIFLEKSPSTEILLKGILKIIEADTNMSPLQYLTFPLFHIPNLSSNSFAQKYGSILNSKAIGLLRRATFSQSKKEADSEIFPHQLLSSWHVAPIHLPLVGQNCWPHMSEGFSVSLWFNLESVHEAENTLEKGKRIKKRKKTSFIQDDSLDDTESVECMNSGEKLLEEGCIHLISLGSKALMIQVWADLSTGAFIFRMCIDSNDDTKVGLIAQAESQENIFLLGKWQHLALTYFQQPEGKKNIHGKFSMWVSGQRSKGRQSFKVLCIVGWYFLTNHLFSSNVGAKIGSQEAFYLYACGPDYTSLMPCKYGKPVNDHSKYISKEILQCEQIRELFMTQKEVDIDLLIEGLAIVYTTCYPAQYTIYEPVIRLKGQVKAAQSQRPFSLKEAQSSLLKPHYLKCLQPTEYKSLQGILHEIGGTGAFVFLFARVSIRDNRITQSYNPSGLKILSINENGHFKLDIESTAVIQDVKLLEELLLDWKIWSKAKQGVWETLLAALEVLIRANHHLQMFNIKQLLKARVVHHFLLTCQVLQEHKEGHLTSMPREVCGSFVKIIQEVLGSPPDLELLTLIFNFLLAVHPPTNTYVCHNPTNFYFSLHIDGKIFQEKVQSIMYLRHSSSGGKSIASPGFKVISPSGFAASFSEGSSSSNIIPLHNIVQILHSRSVPASPASSPLVQPRKLSGSLGWSVDNLQNIPDNDISTQPEKVNSGESVEILKKVQEEIFVSSCESAKTICESEELPSPQIFVNDVPKLESEEYPSIVLDNKDSHAEVRFDGDSPGDEFSLRRPDNLKGLSSFQRSHSIIASLGLAFPSQNGSSAVSRWPSLADKNIVSEDWENFTFSPGYEQTYNQSTSADSSTEDCLVLICCGLYDLLRGVLLILPDIMLEHVMDKVVQPDTLIVLLNHPSPLIQQGVIKLLDAYFIRASKEQKDKFLKNRGFALLANQLYLHQGTQKLLECFMEMFFGCPIILDEEFDLEEVKNMELFQKWCIIPVLGLIETSLSDNILLHNSLFLLLQILNSCSKVADLLLDNGLLFVLCNTIAALNGLETNIPLNDYKLLVCDIQQLLVAVTIHACSSSGSQYFRVIEDLIVLLGYLQKSKNKRTHNMAIALQFRVLQAAIEFIRTTANQDSQNLINSFQFPSIPHYAIFQKRKSIAGPRKSSLAQSESLLMKMRSVASDELNMMMQRRMSQENPIRASETELTQRMQRLIVLAVNRIIYQEFSQDFIDILSIPGTTTQGKTSNSEAEISEEEIQPEELSILNPFQKEMLLIMGSSRTTTPRQQWNKILCSCKETFRMQLGRLLVHLLSPTRPPQQRKQAFEILRLPNHQEILRDCLSPTLQVKMLCDICSVLRRKQIQVPCFGFQSDIVLTCLTFISKSVIVIVSIELMKYEIEESVNKSTWQKTVNNNQQSLFQRLDMKSRDISKIAADITQAVSLSQGIERKKVIQHIRGMYKVDLSSSRRWQELVQQLTHDRALWYDPVSYPTSWQLDPTEGPNRERRRLQRCYLTIPNKYLLKDRQKSEEVIKPPLSYLFEDKTHSSFSSTVKDKAASESIRVNRRCISVAPSRETAGELLLGKCGMYFVEDNASDTVESSVMQMQLIYEV
uniref:Lysosomal trafficking regulator n=1 Tax=Monodelphis domestica TaxID=13616 RepID=A0A5F8GZ26_MONDO